MAQPCLALAVPVRTQPDVAPPHRHRTAVSYRAFAAERRFTATGSWLPSPGRRGHSLVGRRLRFISDLNWVRSRSPRPLPQSLGMASPMIW